MSGRRTGAAVVTAALGLMAVAGSLPARAASPQVLRVGTWQGVAGQYSTIQSAVDAARPGDWVLVGPGDWHEKGAGDPERSAGVLITTASVHLRGMDRNAVIVDGTRPGGAVACDPTPSLQDLGPVDPATHKPAGRNGIEVYSNGFTADGVSVENLTVCNYLSSGEGHNGNQVWWNGGDGSGLIGMGSLYGAYLTASSSYDYAADPANQDQHQAKYGIFTSNERGPGVIEHTYASNMGDSDYYIGACADCSMILRDAHGRNSALGFSGTNAGGHLIIENSEFDANLAGVGPNTLNNDDSPSPADGACPGGGTGPTATHSCLVIRGNYVHDNNNPNTPRAGIAGMAPVGTGILLSGVRNAVVVNNRIESNGAWGVLVTDFPDTSAPPPAAVQQGQACHGGIDLSLPKQPLCYYQAYGNEVTGNAFARNGGFGPGTGDIAQLSIAARSGNCYHGDSDAKGVTTDPPLLETTTVCGLPGAGAGVGSLTLLCASAGALGLPGPSLNCPALPLVRTFPATTRVAMFAIPHAQPSMPDPCAGVPANPWCAAAAAATQAAAIPGTAAAGAGGSGLASALAALGTCALAGLGGPVRRRRHSAGG